MYFVIVNIKLDHCMNLCLIKHLSLYLSWCDDKPLVYLDGGGRSGQETGGRGNDVELKGQGE